MTHCRRLLHRERVCWGDSAVELIIALTVLFILWHDGKKNSFKKINQVLDSGDNPHKQKEAPTTENMMETKAV